MYSCSGSASVQRTVDPMPNGLPQHSCCHPSTHTVRRTSPVCRVMRSGRPLFLGDEPCVEDGHVPQQSTADLDGRREAALLAKPPDHLDRHSSALSDVLDCEQSLSRWLSHRDHLRDLLVWPLAAPGDDEWVALPFPSHQI